MRHRDVAGGISGNPAMRGEHVGCSSIKRRDNDPHPPKPLRQPHRQLHCLRESCRFGLRYWHSEGDLLCWSCWERVEHLDHKAVDVIAACRAFRCGEAGGGFRASAR